MLYHDLVSLFTLKQLILERNFSNIILSSDNRAIADCPFMVMCSKRSLYGGNRKASSLFSSAVESADSVSRIMHSLPLRSRKYSDSTFVDLSMFTELSIFPTLNLGGLTIICPIALNVKIGTLYSANRCIKPLPPLECTRLLIFIPPVLLWPSETSTAV